MKLINKVLLACAFLVLASTAQAKRNAVAKTVDADPAYQRGLRLYAAGRLPQARDAFRLALKRHPHERAAQSAVRRVETELTYRIPSSEEAEEPSWFDSLVLDDVPAFLNFDDSIGDSLTAEGASQARGGRVSQLLAERKLAAERGRSFTKERELRALIRRATA